MTIGTRIRCLFGMVAFAAVLTAACDDDTPVEVVDPCTLNPCSIEAVVTQLQTAYERLDPDLLVTLLHPDFLYQLQPDPLNPGQPNDWGRVEEARIHRRMFRPQEIPPSEDPVPEELWLDGVTISLSAAGPWQERPEFYASPTNPDGLDSTLVKVSGVDYSYSVLFETRGETDYQVGGQSYFVVVADRSKQPNEPGAFLLYRWQDLGSINRSSEATWSQVKALYG